MGAGVARHGRWAIRAAAIGVLLVGMAALTAVGMQSPSETGWLPECPSRAAFGVNCAGCGSTRAVHELMNGRLAQALRLNPLGVVVGVPLAGVLGGVLLMAGWLGRWPPRRLPEVPALAIWGVLLILVVYTVLRNPGLGGPAWLVPPESGAAGVTR